VGRADLPLTIGVGSGKLKTVVALSYPISTGSKPRISSGSDWFTTRPISSNLAVGDQYPQFAADEPSGQRLRSRPASVVAADTRSSGTSTAGLEDAHKRVAADLRALADSTWPISVRAKAPDYIHRYINGHRRPGTSSDPDQRFSPHPEQPPEVVRHRLRLRITWLINFGALVGPSNVGQK